ncbi:ribonuclease P protein subunit p14-like [Asterias amurensis]|uniref:ribonuclease P protein subunit p14-like n=1 Tax=Asterias amurensis TaxID=7602 RepID=UPI003AB463DE
MTLFQRTVSKGSAEYFFLKVAIEFVDSGISTDSLTFKLVVTKALKELFGDAGAAIPVDILGFLDQTMEAILRVPGRSVVKLWSALTLLSECGGEECAIRVKQVSPHLMSLAVNSRQFYQNLPS